MRIGLGDVRRVSEPFVGANQGTTPEEAPVIPGFELPTTIWLLRFAPLFLFCRAEKSQQSRPFGEPED